MTDAKKPIELHLVGQENFTIFASLDSAEQAQELVSSIRRSNQPCYLHVIEKSAYDKLLARVEKLETSLKYLRDEMRDMPIHILDFVEKSLYDAEK